MITGGSYGGHMTLAIAATTTTRSAAEGGGSDVEPGDLPREHRGLSPRPRRAEYGDEREPKMREFLTRIAPMTMAQNIRKPMYIVQGSNDPRVPYTEAEQLVKTLKANGTPAWYLLGLNEGHGFAKKENQDFDFYTTIMFIQKYLLE
jgi:dipeptidyl aminopeptidase/acylaminoacyl peptidase